MDVRKILAGAVIVVVASFGWRIASQQQTEAASEAQKKAPEINQQEAALVIQDILKHNAPLTIKLSHPLLPGKVRQWQIKGELQFPTKQVLWATFKKDMQQLVPLLHALAAKKSDKEYLRLKLLNKNPEIYNGLKQMKEALVTHESNIESGAPFKLSKESLRAMQAIINVYGTQFYQNKLIEKLAQELKRVDGEINKNADTKKDSFAEFDYEAYQFPDEAPIEYDYSQESYQVPYEPSYEPSYEPDSDYGSLMDEDYGFAESFFE